MPGVVRFLLPALLVLFLAPPATGSTIKITSPRIGPPFDLRSASHGHDGTLAVRHVIRMYDPWTARWLQGRGSIDLQLFLDDGRTLAAVVSGQRGYLRVRLYENGSSSSLPFTRPDRRSIAITIPRARLGFPSAYAWRVDAYFDDGESVCGSGGLCDRLPAGRLPLHDISPPDTDLMSFPDPTTEASNSLSVDVSFGLSDPFSGVSWWALQRRLYPTGTWADHASGFGAFDERSFTVNVQQSRTFEFRVIAADGQGNRLTSPTRLVTFPMDDGAAALAGGFAGTWGTADASSLDYRETLHTSTEVGATFTHSFTGTYVAWIARGGGPGTANVSVDGGSPHLVDLAALSGNHRTAFSASLPPGPHSITITVAGGTVSVDGLAVR